MPFLSLENLQVRKGITAEQNILFAQFYAFFNSNAAAHRRILNVEELYFIGNIGGEFTVYANTKMYLGLTLYIHGASTDLANRPFIQLNNESNVDAGQISNDESHFDTNSAPPAHHFNPNYIKLYNVYFSRLVVQSYSAMVFIGFRVTLS